VNNYSINDMIANHDAAAATARAAQRALTASLSHMQRDYYTAEEAAAENDGYELGYGFRMAELAYDLRTAGKLAR